MPGTVLHDLWRAGEVPDPYRERNSLLVEWVPERTWLYRRRFRLDGADGVPRRRRARLRFQGVDHAARFFLDGEELGRHEGMFTPVTFELGRSVDDGEEHFLVVAVEPAPRDEPQVGDTRRVRNHKSRMTYGWDFCPRLVHQGIWQPVSVDVTGRARIEDVFVRPLVPAPARSPAPDPEPVDVDVSVTASLEEAVDALRVDVRISREGPEVASGGTTIAVAGGVTSVDPVRLHVERPDLWWPNGLGPQPLYRCRVELRTADGELSDVREVTFGIRHVELVPNETAPRDARPYTLSVNGRRLYANGWNWVPVDALYGVPRADKVERLLTLARDAHVNLLRVWGGGLIETEGFYDLCDRLGILVWQEFIQSSSGLANEPSDDASFVSMMAADAASIVPSRRNHPSLAIWCGGNELSGEGNVPLDERAPVLGALAQAVARLDPDRQWLPTSPSGPHFLNSLAAIEADPDGLHDVHGPWEHQGLTGQYRLYDAGTSLLHSEFGAEGMTNRRAIEATLDPEHRWPPTRDNPVWAHRGDWWINEPLVQEAFGGGIGDLDTLRRASQFLQAEGLRYAVEANRRRWPRNSGSIPWQFDESYPNGWCTSAVDYYGEPKAAYHAVADAYRPLAPSARFATQAWGGRERFEAEVWAWSDEALPEATVETRVVGVRGTVYAARRFHAGPTSPGPTRVGTVESAVAAIEDELFFLDLYLAIEERRGRAGRGTGTRYVFSRTGDLAPMLAVRPGRLDVAAEGAQRDWRVRLRNAGDSVILLARLEAARAAGDDERAAFSANDLILLPGEEQAVRVDWRGVPERQRRVTVEAWNTGVIPVR